MDEKPFEGKGESKTVKKFGLARDLAMLVSEDLLPFSLVEGSEFRKFLFRKALASTESKIPRRTTISRGVLNDASEAVQKLLIARIPKKTRHHVFAPPHTGVAIFEEAIRTLRDFELSEKTVFAAVTHSGSDMICCLKKFVHIRCADHRLQRALTKDLYETSSGKKL